MFISLNWLKEYVEIPKSLTPEALGLKLTMHTVEVDSVKKLADRYYNVVVAKILEVKAHPQADKLRLAMVDTGQDKREIVCGADNIRAGQMVPLALPGAVLPSGLKIEAAVIRGVESHGMLCAPDELGLGDDHSGIMILSEQAKKGQALAVHLKLDDVVYELDNKSITHRPDLWGHIGLAREAGAFLNAHLTKKYQEVWQEELKPDSAELKLKVEVADTKRCPRYMAVAVNGVKIGQSPDWLKERLTAVGVRPINNIVDATNYVMLETGQPLHAFDARKISAKAKEQGCDSRILVRTAKPGETIVTLDGEERNLSPEDLLITDGERAVAVAGVMGGEDSEIDADTGCIVIESANFDHISTRKTSQRLGLRTEASQRYEKSLDPNLCAVGLRRAALLIKDLCPGAKIASDVADIKDYNLNQGPIILDRDWLASFIGQKIGKADITRILTALGFGLKEEGRTWSVTVPTWRATKDISIKEDLGEEVARVYGYDRITPAMPSLKIKAPARNPYLDLVRSIREQLRGMGLTETYNYSFVGEEQLKRLGVDHSRHIKLANPIASQLNLLRQDLAPNLLLNAKLNQPRVSDLRLFEIGSVFFGVDGNIPKGSTGDEALPLQEKRLGLAISLGDGSDSLSEAKGLIGSLLSRLDLPLRFEKWETPHVWADPSLSALIILDGKEAGYAVEVGQPARQKQGLKRRTVIASLSLDRLLPVLSKRPAKLYREYAKYPPAVRDLAIVVSEKTAYNDIHDAILGFSPQVRSALLFDVFTDEKLGKGKKSLAFHIVFQAEKTLVGAEVDGMMGEIVVLLEKRFDAKLRS